MKFLFLYVAPLSLLFTISSLAHSDDGKNPLIEKATEFRQSLILDMEQEGPPMAYVYAGGVSSVQPESRFSGVFPYVAFRAVRNSGGETQTRYWHLNFVSINRAIGGAAIAYDELLVDEDRWYTQSSQPVRKYEVKKEGPFSYSTMCLDPRVVVLCLTGSVATSRSLQESAYKPVLNGKIIDAKAGLRTLTAVIRVVDSDVHVVFDEAQGNRPTLVATCKKGVEIGSDYQHASNINHMRWKKNSRDIWMPEAGRNSYFFNGTRGAHQYSKELTYKFVWIDAAKLPEETFAVSSLNSTPGVLLDDFSEWIAEADELAELEVEK